ncbi:MAG: ANTAR domain-containing protein [Euzebya sp.]
MSTPGRERRLLQLLVHFTSTMVTEYTAEDALDELMQQVPELLGVDGAGVMLEDDTGELRFISASNDTVRLIEEFQVQTGQGPCVMAYESSQHVQIDDLTKDCPFPTFAEVAVAAGMRAVHSFPMLLDSHHVGALNLYRARIGPLPEDGVEVGQLFADIATTYLFSARTYNRLTRQIEGLKASISQSGAVDQAKGVLMHSHGLQDREAFGLLRRYARAQRVRVLDVAEQLMDGTLDFSTIIEHG